MINALPMTLTVRIFTILVVIFCSIVIANSSASEAKNLIVSQGIVVAAVNGLICLLTLQPVYLWLHKVTFAKHWWFPRLDGKWEVTVWSNWPLVQTTFEAARGDTGSFDPLTQSTQSSAALPVTLIAELKSSLFGIELIMTVPNSTRESRTIFVRPEWRRPAQPRLNYFYKQSDLSSVAVTDASEHLGAGFLDYCPESDQLRGEYWTQRVASKGLNTAGKLLLKRSTV